MKQIYIILVFVIFFSACQESEKPKEITQQEIENLVTIIKNKDTVQIKKLINERNVNSIDSSGVSLLCRAIITQDTNIVKIIVEKGADPSLANKTETKSTPLMMCSNFNMVKTAEFLIEKGADIDASDHNGDPVINWAAYMGEIEFTKMLLEKGARTDQKSIHSDFAIEVALKEWQDSIVDLFTENKKGLYSPDSQLLPLINAFKNNDLNFIKKNITKENINTIDEATNSLLIIASSKGYFDLVKLLLKKGADINYVNQVGFTALNKSVFFKHNKIAEYLIKKGADVNKANERFNLTPLIAASRSNNLEMGKILIKKGADINAVNTIDLFTPIIWAALYENIDFVKLLLKNNPDLSIKSKYDDKDIFQLTGNKEILELLNKQKN